MKRALTFLSVVALATSVFAADKLEPGTADAPNYYVLKTGRGTPYLAYSEVVLTTTSGAETHLHRTNELSVANIWAVTPGDAEGTLHIAAYDSTGGLMDFINKDGSFYELNGVATVAEVRDIYPTYNDDGTVSLSINSVDGFEIVRDGDTYVTTNYYTLDATSSSEFCGNWVPNTEGSNWTAYQLDLTDGVDEALNAFNIDKYIHNLNEYITTVPWVEKELNEGLTALNNMGVNDFSPARISAIYKNAINNANDILATIFDGKTLGIKSIRCEDYGTAPYLGIKNTDDSEEYCGTTALIDPTAVYIFNSVGNGGYTIYNENTRTWIGTSCSPTTDESQAQTFYPMLHSCAIYDKRFYGIALTLTKETTGDALNIQSWENGEFLFYFTNDDGSIWSIVNTNEVDKYREAVEAYVAKLRPYVANVPEGVAAILYKAINQIKGLSFSDNFSDNAENIINSAMDSANEYLASNMNEQNYNIKVLYQDKFLSIADNNWAYTLDNDGEDSKFTFRSVNNGEGYKIYNESTNLWLSSSGATTTDETDALIVYPSLCRGVTYSLGSYYGIVLSLENTKAAVEATTTVKATTYDDILSIGHSSNRSSVDGDAIFALMPFGATTPFVPVESVKLQRIVCKVGDSLEMSAAFEPENASARIFTWSSSNPEVAAVDPDGTVWFNGVGNATVTAECMGCEFSMPFVVKEIMAQALNVFPVEAVGGIGYEFSLLALHEPENTTDKSVTWESSDPAVATVNEDGRVSLASLGTAQITARSGEHTAVCVITVDNTVGLTEMASTGVVIDIIDGGIIVRNVPIGESIAIYSVDGKAINGAVVASEETKLNLAAGIYIVKISPSTVAKVLIK